MLPLLLVAVLLLPLLALPPRAMAESAPKPERVLVVYDSLALGTPRQGNVESLERLLAAAPAVQTVVLPRTDAQREALAGTAAIVPERPVDGPSLVAAADLVVSAGGTMNREAAALGVPAYTPFAARLGAVDRSLIARDRLRRLEDPGDVALVKRPAGERPPLRDPDILLDLILGAAITLGPA